MIRPVLMILLPALMAAPALAAGPQEAIPLPGSWSTVYVCFLVVNPEYDAGTPEEEKAITTAHIQYQLRLQRDGRAIAAGGLGPGSQESIVGMTLLRGESLEQATEVAGNDPAVRAGRLNILVREWWVPEGRLPGPPGREK